MDKRKLECLRCGSDMKYTMTEKIQLGQTGWIFGDLPNLIAGAMQVDVYSCPNCVKIEFFQSDDTDISDSEPSIAQRKCPKCCNLHDIDYPRCPFCKHNYN